MPRRQRPNKLLKFNPKPLEIISYHAGTILAEEPPEFELTSEETSLAIATFDKLITKEEIGLSIVNLKVALTELRFDMTELSEERLGPYLEELSAKRGIEVESPDFIVNSDEFLAIYTNLYAPARVYSSRLRKACARGENNIVTDLLSRGCDMNLCDGTGFTAMHYAAQYGRASTIDLLSRFTEDCLALVNASGPVGDIRNGNWTPLMIAAANGHANAVSKLLNKGANAAAKTSEGRTALHWAASNNREAVMKLLLRNGSSVNERDSSGWTPLHCALLHGHSSCAIQLCKSGADISATDELGYTGKEYCTDEIWEEIEAHS